MCWCEGCGVRVVCVGVRVVCVSNMCTSTV